MTRVLHAVRLLAFAFVLAWLAGFVTPTSAQAAASCGPATGRGSAAADFRDYCWFDFSEYDDDTADGTLGQLFTFNLPDGTRVTMLVRNTTTAKLVSSAVPAWTGAAFGIAAFTGIPGRPVLYNAADGGLVNLTITILAVQPPAGGSSSYSLVVADGESSNANERLVFTTDGDAWQQIAQIRNGTSNLYPGVSYNTSRKTVTLTGVAGTVGSYVFRSDNNPRTLNVTIDGSGKQGMLIGMRYASVNVVSQVTGSRYNAADQFKYDIATTDGTVRATAATTGTALNGFTPAVLPTVAASYPFTVSQSMVPGSVGNASNYNTTLTCTNASTGSATVMPTNYVGTSYTFPNLRYGDSVSCTFTNVPIFNAIAGTVYSDANHNGSRDGTEAGPGTGFWVKLAPFTNGACTSPAVSPAAAVDASTGAYAFGSVTQGNYCVILDNNSTVTDITPTLPAGWIPTENPTGITQISVTAAQPAPVPQDFGLFRGSRFSGTVFADTGLGSGTANNGVKDGTEAGLANVMVTATSGTTAVATATTGADGTFMLWLANTVSGSVSVVPATPSGYLPTGGSAGTTGGSYVRPNLTYTPVAGNSYTGVGFGFATPNTLVPNGAQTAQPGTVVFYAHTFTAGSGGQVTFSTANAQNPPSGPAWTSVLYRDTNCSAALDTAEPLVNTTMTVTAGQQVCLVVKQFVPAGAAFGTSNTVTLTAAFTYANAAPVLTSTLTVTDITTGGEPNALSLRKMVGNVTRGGAAATAVSALPGEVLQYTVTAQNNGGTPLSTLVINDATPAFTAFVSAACPGVLPTGITGCAISTQPAAGAQGGVQWTFTGTLGAGAQLGVSYQVKVSQ